MIPTVRAARQVHSGEFSSRSSASPAQLLFEIEGLLLDQSPSLFGLLELEFAVDSLALSFAWFLWVEGSANGTLMAGLSGNCNKTSVPAAFPGGIPQAIEKLNFGGVLHFIQLPAPCVPIESVCFIERYQPDKPI